MQHFRSFDTPLGRAAAIVLLMLLCPLALARRHPHAAAPTDVPGHFDYYLLALSWSPGYCVVHPGDRNQCQGRGFGFLLHGLWPQNNSGGYPQTCETNVGVDHAAELVGRGLYPSPQLMAHEWEHHGTCSGLAPMDYFRTADRATAVLRIPSAFEAPRTDQHLSPEQILAAFGAANPALPPHAMAVGCSRNELSEVRLCLTRNLLPRPCGHGVRNSCPAAPILVRAAR